MNTRIGRSALSSTIARWMEGLALPPGWRLASQEVEQGIALGFQGPTGRLVVELDPLDPSRGCYARTGRLNVYYSVVDRLRRDLDAEERAVIDSVVEVLRAREHELPAPPDGPAAPSRVLVRELQAERALVPELPGVYYLNPYVGCLLACPYCYAMHRADGSRALEGEPVLPWGRWLDVKPELPAVLAREVATLAPGVVRMSPIVTDPYQPIERRYRVTRGCLDAMAGTGFVPMILTRSTLVLDDLDRLRAFPRALVGMSVPTNDDAVRAVFEPRTEPIEARLQALRAMHGAGLRTFAVIQPMLPMEPEALVEALAPWVHAVRIAPMYEKGRSASLYQTIGREEAAGEAWELRTFEALRAGFRARGIPVTTREDLHEML